MGLGSGVLEAKFSNAFYKYARFKSLPNYTLKWNQYAEFRFGVELREQIRSSLMREFDEDCRQGNYDKILLKID